MSQIVPNLKHFILCKTGINQPLIPQNRPFIHFWTYDLTKFYIWFMQGNFIPKKGLIRRNGDRPRWSTQLGFTITELLSIVAIISIIASLAVPSFTAIINNQAITATSTNIVALLQTARTEAVKRSQRVKVCFTEQRADFTVSSSTTSCIDPGLTQHKISYLYVFIDNGTFPEVIEGSEELIAATTEFNANLFFNQDSTKKMGTSVEFNQRGGAFFQAGEATTAAYIAICDERSKESVGRLITLNATGRTALSSIPANSHVECYTEPSS